jgi:hypothetical protein
MSTVLDQFFFEYRDDRGSLREAFRLASCQERAQRDFADVVQKENRSDGQ